MKVYVYDIEIYPNIFTIVFREVTREKSYIIFEISSRKNQLLELISFLKKPQKQVGYNNLYFDYPILHYILTHPNVTLEEIYEESQNIINETSPRIWESKHKIEQLDLFKIWHYDNSARSTSLKWLEFALRWYKVQDLPFEPGSIIPIDQFDNLIKYNINDVDFTYFFLGKSLDAIKFRDQMSDYLKHRVMNYSDVAIGEYINRKTYERLSGRYYREFKDSRTYRGNIKISDIVPEFISFKTNELRNFLSDIKTSIVSAEKENKFERVIKIGSLIVTFAKGGLHSQDVPRVFKCNEGWILKEKDVGSMYPSSLINGKMYPAHLGPSWNQGIKVLFDERVLEMKPKMKTLDKNSAEYKFLDAKQQAYKLGMNGGGYGKTGSSYSWQYDPLVMLKVTFRGQLSLLMLIEMYYLEDIEVISANTDGIVIHYPEEKSDIVLKIHKEWESITEYMLEDTCYKQIVFNSVNSYMAEIIDEKSKERIKIKYKNEFEFDMDYHKNNSQRIVPIALKEYFINNVPIKDVICNVGYEFENSKGEKEKTTIFDYCHGRKSNNKVDNYSLVSGDKLIELKDKVIRYYISNSNDKLVKVYNSKKSDGSVKTEAVNKGFNHTLFMEYQEKEDYNLNYDYYINECRKLIKPIEIGTKKIGYERPTQGKLF